jgi:hypothetical protein
MSVVIRDDTDTNYFNLSAMSGPTTGVQGAVAQATPTQVQLFRLTGGAFDGTSYDTFPTFNRGWITIIYTA